MKSFKKELSQDDIRNFNSYNNGYGLILFEKFNGFIQLFNPVLIFYRTGGELSNRDYLILTQRGDLFYSAYNHLKDCETWPMGFTSYEGKLEYRINDNIYITGGAPNPLYEGTALFYCNYNKFDI